MGHHQLHDPLVPGMPPVLTSVLAVGGDATRLHRLVTNVGLLGYQVTSSTDPEAAMARLRLQDFSFHVVMVDTSSHYTDRRAALQLFEFALREPLLCAYAIKEEGTYGPLGMEDINEFRKPIYNAELNGPKSLQVTSNGLNNTSASTAASAISNTSSSGGRTRRNNMKHISDTGSEKVEKDGEHAEMEQQQPAEKPKKARVVWDDKLHNKFMEAYNKLKSRGDDPVPKKIQALMGDPTLTRENIASHLQKYRLTLAREGCIDPLRTIHYRAEQHKSTPQESFPPPNMSQQQALPTVMQSLSATVYANNVFIHVQEINTMDKSNKSVLVDVSPQDVFSGADDPKQSSASCVDTSDGNSVQEDTISTILSKEPKPSWDAEFLHSNGD